MAKGFHVVRAGGRSAFGTGIQRVALCGAGGFNDLRLGIVVPRCGHIIGIPGCAAGTGLHGIALGSTGRHYRSGLRVGMSMVNLLRDGLTSADAVQVIGVANAALAGIAAAGCAAQSPAAGPAKGPIPTVVIGGGIAAAVIGNGMAVVSRQQVFPAGIPVSVWCRYSTYNLDIKHLRKQLPTLGVVDPVWDICFQNFLELKDFLWGISLRYCNPAILLPAKIGQANKFLFLIFTQFPGT